ncbi:MAG: hypothetical protein ACLVIU_02670 [Paraclostridium sp.]
MINFYKSVDLDGILSIAQLIYKKLIIYLFTHDASNTLNSFLKCITRTKIFYNSWLLPIALINILTSNLAMLIEDNSDF